MRWITIFLLLMACDSVGTQEDLDQDLECSVTDTEVCFDGWLCWDPGTSLHNKPCTEECMEVGNMNKFCFLNSCE
mgnify:FL=1